jgi:hypothetical protein
MPAALSSRAPHPPEIDLEGDLDRIQVHGRHILGATHASLAGEVERKLSNLMAGFALARSSSEPTARKAKPTE